MGRLGTRIGPRLPEYPAKGGFAARFTETRGWGEIFLRSDEVENSLREGTVAGVGASRGRLLPSLDPSIETNLNGLSTIDYFFKAYSRSVEHKEAGVSGSAEVTKVGTKGGEVDSRIFTYLSNEIIPELTRTSSGILLNCRVRGAYEGIFHRVPCFKVKYKRRDP